MSEGPSEKLVRRRDETREIAANFVDDVELINEILNGDTPNRAKLRLLSSVVRRLFRQQQELVRIAAPRLPDFAIVCPDLRPLRDIDPEPIFFFAAGGGKAFGIEAQGAVVNKGSEPLDLGSFHPDVSAPQKIEDFLNTNTIFWDQRWFNRKEIIDFTCNKLGGSHTGKLSNSKERSLKRLCSAGGISMISGMPQVTAPVPNTQYEEGKLRLRNGEIDFVLFELLSILRFFAESPNTKELCEIIKRD